MIVQLIMKSEGEAIWPRPGMLLQVPGLHGGSEGAGRGHSSQEIIPNQNIPFRLFQNSLLEHIYKTVLRIDVSFTFYERIYYYGEFYK